MRACRTLLNENVLGIYSVVAIACVSRKDEPVVREASGLSSVGCRIEDARVLRSESRRCVEQLSHVLSNRFKPTERCKTYVELVVRVCAVRCPQRTIRCAGESVRGTGRGREDVSNVCPGSSVGRCADLNASTSC